MPPKTAAAADPLSSARREKLIWVLPEILLFLKSYPTDRRIVGRFLDGLIAAYELGGNIELTRIAATSCIGQPRNRQPSHIDVNSNRLSVTI
jgi:hypothetical protein